MLTPMAAAWVAECCTFRQRTCRMFFTIGILPEKFLRGAPCSTVQRLLKRGLRAMLLSCKKLPSHCSGMSWAQIALGAAR